MEGLLIAVCHREYCTEISAGRSVKSKQGLVEWAVMDPRKDQPLIPVADLSPMLLCSTRQAYLPGFGI